MREEGSEKDRRNLRRKNVRVLIRYIEEHKMSALIAQDEHLGTRRIHGIEGGVVLTIHF